MEGAGRMSDIVLSVRDLHLRRGARSILNGVTLEIERGQIVALMGASGSGKTTILRAIAALEPFEQGVISVDGVTLEPGRLSGAATKELRRKVGMVFQFHCLFEHLSALQNVSLAPVHVQHVARADAERRALELMTSLGVEHRAQAFPRELSGGEAQRVAIARALATDPPLLLMDEPTASLDPARRFELAAVLRSLVTGGRRTLVVVTHDEDFARHVGTHLLQVREGRIAPG
jgi:ABC-type polar amino acid transport system ATPase subunit